MDPFSDLLQFRGAGLRTSQCAGAANKPCWNQSLHLQYNYSTACFIWPPSSVWLICPTKLVTSGTERINTQLLLCCALDALSLKRTPKHVYILILLTCFPIILAPFKINSVAYSLPFVTGAYWLSLIVSSSTKEYYSLVRLDCFCWIGFRVLNTKDLRKVWKNRHISVSKDSFCVPLGPSVVYPNK